MKNASSVLLMMLAPGLLCATLAAAQTPGTCQPGASATLLEVNEVRAQIFNDGLLFGRGGTREWIYEVPKGSGLTAIWHASLVLAGRVDGDLRAAATLYGPPEFWPGPLDDEGEPPPRCALYDRLYQITRQDVERYNETGLGTPDLLEWPYHLGAPVLDGDGDLDNYNLEAGDRPALVGDAMVWWIMNDAGNAHTRTQSQPLGMEIRATAFAHRAGNYLGATTFYRYRLRYKGKAPLEDAYFGIVSDTRPTDGDNRYIATDTTLGIAYVYYPDNYDQHAWQEGPAYGEAPPAIGYTFLRTAADADGRDNNRDGAIDEPGEQQGLWATMPHNNGGGVTEDPIYARDFYNYLRARWKDGKPLTVGGNGRDFSFTSTRFAYPGDPVTGAYWSAVNCDGQGNPCLTNVRYMLSTGPFSMQPGEEVEIVFALVWSRGADYLDSVRQLRDDVRHLRSFADFLLEPVSIPHEPPPEPGHVLGFAQNFPNPFRETTTIRYSLPKAVSVRIAVYDMLGREVALLIDRRQEAGVYSIDFAGRGLPPGAYGARFQIDSFSFTKSMMVIR